MCPSERQCMNPLKYLQYRICSLIMSLSHDDMQQAIAGKGQQPDPFIQRMPVKTVFKEQSND